MYVQTTLNNQIYVGFKGNLNRIWCVLYGHSSLSSKSLQADKCTGNKLTVSWSQSLIFPRRTRLIIYSAQANNHAARRHFEQS